VGKPSKSSRDVSPLAAALMAGGTAVMWAEVVVRYLMTGSFDYRNLILPEKSGDVLAIWLAALAVGVVVSVIAYLSFRRGRRVGSLRAWIAILLISAFLQYL
jgi:hypothetical protein